MRGAGRCTGTAPRLHPMPSDALCAALACGGKAGLGATVTGALVMAARLDRDVHALSPAMHHSVLTSWSESPISWFGA